MIDYEKIRQIVREEIDATDGLQEDDTSPVDAPWIWTDADGGQFNVFPLLSDNQLRIYEETGRYVAPGVNVIQQYIASANIVKSGRRQIADTPQGERLRRFMEANQEHFG